jgi:cell wall-associated NlpC family hydrolase
MSPALSLPSREDVVAEALTWVGTPYRKNARVKGAGVDCATLLFCVYQNCGLIPKGDEGIFEDERIVPVHQDWFCHTSEERYLRLVLRYAHCVAETVCARCIKALPGSLALTRAVGSRVYNHGGIVLQWPRVLHATGAAARGVDEADATRHHLWERQVVTIFDPWMKRESGEPQ